MKRLATTMVCFFLTLTAWAETYSFGVVPHRSAAIVKQAPPFGFVAAREADYDKQRAVYRLIWKQEGR